MGQQSGELVSIVEKPQGNPCENGISTIKVWVWETHCHLDSRLGGKGDMYTLTIPNPKQYDADARTNQAIAKPCRPHVKIKLLASSPPVALTRNWFDLGLGSTARVRL